VKNVVVVGRRRVLWCSPTVRARQHDKRVADNSRLRLPSGVDLLGDSGFEGMKAGEAVGVGIGGKDPIPTGRVGPNNGCSLRPNPTCESQKSGAPRNGLRAEPSRQGATTVGGGRSG